LIHATIWPQQIWAENWVGAVPLWGGGAGSPSNTMWPWPRPTCVPSFILICPTVWPQCTNVTDRQTDRQDRTTVRWHRANSFTNGGPINEYRVNNKVMPAAGQLVPERSQLVPSRPYLWSQVGEGKSVYHLHSGRCQNS